VLFTEHNRPGAIEDPSQYATAADVTVTRIPSLGLSLGTPVGWRVVRCACKRGVHRRPAFTFSGAPRPDEYSELDGWMTFSATSETVNHLVARLSKGYGVAQEVTADGGAVLYRSTVKIGGVSFHALYFGFWEGAQDLYVGRVGRRTIVIEIEPGYVDDPTLRSILDSIRFV
jgi:hypothetical protein